MPEFMITLSVPEILNMIIDVCLLALIIYMIVEK